MSLSDDFTNAVIEGKATKVRIMMKDSLLLDNSGKGFDEMLNFAQDHIPDIICEHDGEQFRTSEEWSEDYLNEQMVAVVNNFSEERIRLLKDMVRQLYGKKNDNQEEIQRAQSTEKEFIPSSGPEQNGIPVVKVVGGGLVAVGAVTLVGGLAFHAPIWVPITGGVAIGVGAYLLLK